MINLYAHQKLALALLKNNPSFALFWEAGCGKTIPTILHILHLVKTGEITNALIVAPKAVMGSWVRDLEKLEDKDREIAKRTITIINYDLVWRRKEYDKTWDCIVLDESHCIKDRTSQRGSFLLKLSLKSRYRYILTGTPLGNKKLEDFWSQLAFLKPFEIRGRVASEWLGTWGKFIDKYCFLNKYYKPYRYRNVSELQGIIGEHSHRLTKDEALDLPDQVDIVYDIELSKPTIYRKLMSDSALLEFEILASNPLVKLAKLRQLCSGFIIDEAHDVHKLPCEKEKALKEFLEGFSRKLVIFAEFKFSIKNICKVLDGLKIKHVVLDGEQKNKTIWRDFQNDDSIQVIVCQYQSANAGIDLFKADTTLYYEPTMSATVYEQTRGRIHRVGQTSKCTYIHFITKNSIENKIKHSLDNSVDFTNKMFTQYLEDYQKGARG